MGQAQTREPVRHVTTGQLSHELAVKFSKHCFTPLELYSFQDVFHSLADRQESISYLREKTLARFLEIPDILGVSSILFQLASSLGAFPFLQDAPAILGFEQMVLVVCIMTDRHIKLLKNGSSGRTRLIFRSLAVFDRAEGSRKVAEATKDEAVNATSPCTDTSDQGVQRLSGFAVDAASGVEDDDDDDDDGLVLAALEALDATEVFKHGDMPIAQASIPSDNMRKLIMLLLLIAPLRVQESLTKYSDRLSGEILKSLQRTADSILAAFTNVEKYPGIKIHQFCNVIPVSFPFMFNAFNSLFEKFLFSKNLDFTKHKGSVIPTSTTIPEEVNRPPLPQDSEILDINVLSQISLFLPGSSLFGCLRLLYSGVDAGFAMGSFEQNVFNWRAPTILLVSGNRISDPPSGSREKLFVSTLQPKRFPDSSRLSRVVFGVYLSQPWRQTPKDCIGAADTLLFQLEPTHEVFRPSSINDNYVSFIKNPTSLAGIGVGCPPPKPKPRTESDRLVLGSVSLFLDSAFEYGVFTHNYTTRGGAFHASSSRRYDFQDRFEIESLEVWGCGGDKEAEQQRQRWAWEEREAEARRKINLGTSDIGADRALLEMAGIIGTGKSGGSMG